MKPKLIVICGQTATGKSDLAVLVAKKWNGEVVSADSRQVYRGLDLGSGKITQEEMGGVPHHMLDVCDPKETYSVSLYKKQAISVIEDIISRGKLPILVGGTGQYIEAIVDNPSFPEVAPNLALRALLEDMTTPELLSLLESKDARRASEMDTNNRHRIIRALEIYDALGTIPLATKGEGLFDTLSIGLFLDKQTLQEKIEKRIEKRIAQGMIEEVRELNKKGLSWQRLESFGLEYQHIAEYLQGKKTHEEMLYILAIKIRQFAKRQLTWFRRDNRVHWFDPTEQEGIFKTIEEFLD